MRYDDERVNDQHAKFPERGDYWHDHFCGVYCVVDVSDFHVALLTKKIESDGGWLWDINQVSVMTRREFNEKVRYRGLGSTTESIADKTWCDVVPRRCLDFAEEALKNARVAA